MKKLTRIFYYRWKSKEYKMVEEEDGKPSDKDREGKERKIDKNEGRQTERE